MAGGFLAAALANSGLTISLVDGAPAQQMPTGDPLLRVVALAESSQRMLQNTGVWQALDQSRIMPFQRMAVWDSDGTGSIEFDAAKANADALGWIVENNHLVAALNNHLSTASNVEWHNHCRVKAIRRQITGWLVELDDGTCLEPQLLIGADGANSFVRQSVGISAKQHNSGHHALVTWLTTELPHEACARQWFLPTGPLAFLPLFGDGHQVSIVWSGVPSRIEQLMSLSLDELSTELTLASEGALGRVTPKMPAVRFPIVERHASHYVANQVALIGDAAHVIHPLAGQGINLGLLDAGVLAEEILLAKQQSLAVGGEATLARYQRRRKAHNMIMQHAMRGFQRIYAEPSPAIRWLRNTGMSVLNDLDLVKQALIGQAQGRFVDLPQIAKVN